MSSEKVLSSSLLKRLKKQKSNFQSAICDWARENLREFPWRSNKTPYSVLISEILLRRTTATAVKRIFNKFLEQYPDMTVLSKAKTEDLEAILSRVGYHRQRAKIFKEVANFILSEYSGKIPKSKEKLLNIPHVGMYISGAILSFGYGKKSSIVDSNIERILRRFFSERLPKKGQMKTIYLLAKELVPSDAHELFNYGLLDLGALVCRYNTPRHNICPLREWCDIPRQSSNKEALSA